MSLKLIRVALMALLTTLLGFGSNASAESYHGFVRDAYYIGKGGKVVSPKDFAANPQKYTRSDVVLLALREHISRVVGKPLGDVEFRALFASDEVRLVPCTGQINTAGVTNAGKIAWHERKCYQGENLIEVKVPGGWMVAASQGCYNPVEGVRPVPPKPVAAAPVDGVCGPAAGEYSATATALRGQLCAVGIGPLSLTMPAPGGSATYPCLGADGGRLSMCTVVRASLPPLPPPEKKCELVLRRYIVPMPGQNIFIPGLSVEACNGTVAIPATFGSIPSSVSVTSRVEEVCD